VCGIVGAISGCSSYSKDFLNLQVKSMLQALSHRGSSDGFYNDEKCFLGHRRLSIIDLSAEASQPMKSLCGRYVITFNGEIYNYIELRDELFRHGITISSKSDTEVLLYSYILWGKGCLNRLRGIFAFAIWDTQKKRLFAARDHLGVKPLYWFYKGFG